MLRDLSESLSRHLLQVFPPQHGYGRTEFSREPMPPLISTFLAQMLQSRVDLEAGRLRELRSDWFDFDHPDVQHAQATLVTVLGQQVRIPKEEWPRLLREAVGLVLAYLVQPVPTLIDFVFDEDEGTIPTSEIFRGFAFFGAYPYLREVAGAYFQQKHIREIDRKRFESVLRHSDRQMTRDHDTAAWMRLLAPLYGTLGTDPANAGRTIPIDVLDAFLAEKEARLLQAKLKEATEHDEHARISEPDLRRLLETPAYQPAPVAVQEAIHQPIAPPPALQEAAPAQPVVRAAEAPAARAPLQQPAAHRPQPAEQRAAPLWQQFQKNAAGPAPVHDALMPTGQREAFRRPPPPPPVVPKVQPRPAPPPPEPAPGASPAPLWTRFRKAGTPEPAGNDLTALERAVLGDTGPKNRDVFVTQLFAGSQPEYERVLRQLSMAGSWNNASRVIAHEIFRRNHVNIYSEPAVIFTDAVEEQYRQ